MRLRIDLSYDGAGFHGWARQTNLRSVQEDVETALDTVLRTTGTSLTCAGRTDAGVHARGQVVHVDLDPDLLTWATSRAAESPVSSLVRRLNGLLAHDVRVHRVTEAPAGFDARFSALWRQYAYRIADRVDLVDPLTRNHVLAWPRELNLAAMNEAAAALLGEHDFASFCRKRVGATTIRTLQDLTLARDDHGLAVATVRADAFCHSMVRALVGCLLAVGDGRRTPDWPAQVLAGRRRDPGVTVARAHGLTLEEVRYPQDEQMAAQARSARVTRTLPEDRLAGA